MSADLKCQACGAVLATRLSVSVAVDRLKFADGQPLTPRGVALISSEPMQWSEDPAKRAPLQFSPQYWLNPGDVETAVEPVDDPRRLGGCCGLAGSNGPNMRCRCCKAEIGTRQSDCWTWDVFIPQPSATLWTGLDQ